jgi:hypothetical protein
MSRHLRQHETGGSRPVTRHRDDDDAWAELLAAKQVPDGGRRVPSNIMRRPVSLPPMRNIKDAG